MRLATTFDLFGWYDEVRRMGRPIAWCSAFAPAEWLIALGYVPVYPENHAAMLGALSETRDPDAPYSRQAIATSTAAGLASPRLCSYALADLGTLHGAPSPLGAMPEPDLFYACDSQCAVVARWGEEVQKHFAGRGRNVPHLVLRAPPLRGEAHTPAELAGFRDQLAQHARTLGRTLDEARLAQVVAESAEANRLWQRCLELGRRRPAPWTSFEAFTAMAPIVVARGFPQCTDYYRRLLAELESRAPAVPGERKRLLWDAIPVWPRRNWLAKELAERGVAMVVSTYTHSWWFEFDASRPLETLVERYAWNTMNRSADWVLRWTNGLAEDFAVDGIIAHWNRSCGIWNSYVKRRLPGFARPTWLLEADMVDASAFDESHVRRELDAFVMSLG